MSARGVVCWTCPLPLCGARVIQHEEFFQDDLLYLSGRKNHA